MTQLSLSALSDIFTRVKSSFRFKDDDENAEHWQMPPPGYDGQQLLRDDCDGFCLACRTLLRQADIPNRLVYCEIYELGRYFGHLVVEVEGWILDVRQVNVVPNTTLVNYKWRRISGFEPGDPWCEVVGLEEMEDSMPVMVAAE